MSKTLHSADNISVTGGIYGLDEGHTFEMQFTILINGKLKSHTLELILSKEFKMLDESIWISTYSLLKSMGYDLGWSEKSPEDFEYPQDIINRYLQSIMSGYELDENGKYVRI